MTPGLARHAASRCWTLDDWTFLACRWNTFHLDEHSLHSQTSPAQWRVALTQEERSLVEGQDLPEVECRSQLARILQSADFEATARGHKFLSYVVDEELSGRGDRIKAYSIAVEVFGRDTSFDPQTDPIVRIEAGHLRRSLERYYLTSGQSDPILITIPKGGYVPTFTPRHDGVDAAVLTAPSATDAALETGVSPPSRSRRLG